MVVRSPRVINPTSKISGWVVGNRVSTVRTWLIDTVSSKITGARDDTVDFVVAQLGKYFIVGIPQAICNPVPYS
jgi:hypothetical protein